jgi:4-diphosphocytidyl-2-C-methyl-D-erythritol kinase
MSMRQIDRYLEEGGYAGRSFSMRAPCKLNLRLKVEGRRLDGYHLLSMLNVTTGLADEIDITLNGREPEVSISVDENCGALDTRGLHGAGDNLASRAATNFLGRWKISCGVRLALRKIIPIGSGLGGGSSDAAVVLSFLSQVFDAHLKKEGVTDEALRQGVLEEALSLGADVPYFLSGGFAHVTGIGEEIRKLPGACIAGSECLIFVPPVFNETKAIYASFRALHPDLPIKHDLPARAFTPDYAEPASADRDELLSLVENDFEPMVTMHSPLIGEFLGWLRKRQDSVSAMTGSGSAMFSIPRAPSGFTEEAIREISAACEERSIRMIRTLIADGG